MVYENTWCLVWHRIALNTAYNICRYIISMTYVVTVRFVSYIE